MPTMKTLDQSATANYASYHVFEYRLTAPSGPWRILLSMRADDTPEQVRRHLESRFSCAAQVRVKIPATGKRMGPGVTHGQ